MSDMQNLVGRTVVAVEDQHTTHGFALTFDDGTMMEVEAEMEYGNPLLDIEFKHALVHAPR
jgi:hypothetical protein